MGSAMRTPAVIPRSQALQPPSASAKRLVDQLHLPGLPGGGEGQTKWYPLQDGGYSGYYLRCAYWANVWMGEMQGELPRLV